MMNIEPQWPIGCKGSFQYKRLPFAPKFHADETLHSWMTRLAHAYGETPRTFLYGLGFRGQEKKSRSAQPELHCTPEFFERMSALTGVPRTRLKGWGSPMAPSLLDMRDRTGVCTKCWAERKRQDAAYLSVRWANEWSFTCDIHDVPLWEVNAPNGRERWTDWNHVFAARSVWATWSAESLSNAWTDACTTLNVDAEEEWRRAKGFLRGLRILRAELSSNQEIDPVLVVITDLINFLQIQWTAISHSHTRSVVLPCAVRNPKENNLCVERRHIGAHCVRLLAVLIARRLYRRLQRQSEPESTFVEDLCSLLPEAVNKMNGRWWLLRRFNLWPENLRCAGLKLFGLDPEDLIVGPHTQDCLTCIMHRSNRPFRIMAGVKVDPRWHCEFDSWSWDVSTTGRSTSKITVDQAMDHLEARYFRR